MEKLLIAIVITCAVLFTYISSTFNAPGINPTQPQQVQAKRDFRVGVNFTGTQFVITNLDDNDCIGSRMAVDNKYELNDYTLEKGQSYTVGAAQFADGSGVRFNPFALKPSSFSVICQGNNGLTHAYWTGMF